ncbi:MAG TPA: diguanylate cyclase, partial [Anaeromyxobacteraceae bacterium]|nr:diguanylate cyclase [Anaeromyxobacteraceae bacterium]
AIDAIESACERPLEAGEPSSVLVLFHVETVLEVNRRRGYAAGDRLLIALSRALRTSLPRARIRARWSGSTFAALLSGEGAADVIERARGALGHVAVSHAPEAFPVRIRCGFAARRPGASAPEWVAAAEDALRQTGG